MDNHILPVEIYTKIFSHITDTKTLLNIRLSCKLFYFLNKNIKIFRNNKFYYTYKFNDNFETQNLLDILDNKNRVIGFIQFDLNGYTKICNDLKINVQNNTVFYRDYNSEFYISRIYDIITQKTDENIIKSICNLS